MNNYKFVESRPKMCICKDNKHIAVMLTCTPPLSLDGTIEDRPTKIRPKLDCAIYYLCDVRLIPGLLWGAFFFLNGQPQLTIGN